MPADTEQIRRGLSRPEAYAHRPATVDVHETHISCVFVAGERVYKLKKPLVLDFVDYGTPERRQQMCQEEVRLNRRLAPGIYAGVRGVAAVPGGVELTDEDDPRACDYVVEMARYKEADTLAARLDRGELSEAQVRQTGTVLASFHAGSGRVSIEGPAALRAERGFARNLHELLGCLTVGDEISRVQALARFAHAYVSAHAAVLQLRADQGCIREGHGDLRAEHIVVGREVQVVDCVEFDPSLRTLDVADDLAFLVYDLIARGGQRFVPVLLAAYREAGGDPGDDSLISFYAVHRALVRAKVALSRAAQQPPGGAARGRATAHARDRILLAERLAWRARLPLLLIICGVPASGKTHLARALSETAGLPHLSSDVVRKRLAGVAPAQPAPSQAYGPEWNARTYQALAQRTAEALSEQRGAIVDATFRHLADRQAFASACRLAAPVVFVECLAPAGVLLHRAAHRSPEQAGASDADTGVVRRERLSWDPLDEVTADAHIAVRTDRPLPEILGDVTALLDTRLARLELASQ